uniref:proteasome endopeptidase complex n=1 Tax=Sinocyclocheilus grahami TaxID=75366 RepID=A0A672K822_SINGR
VWNVRKPSFLKHSTSIMAVEFEGGVVIGTASVSLAGASRLHPGLPQVQRRTRLLPRDVSPALTLVFCLSFSIELDEAPLVQTAASLFREMCYRYREELMAGIIVAGWDPRRGGQVYTVPVGGMMTRQPVSVGGSGSSYIYGYVDSNYRAGMSKEECLKFTAEALTLAMERDGSSGGVVRLAVVSEQGVERQVILGNQLPKFSTV